MVPQVVTTIFRSDLSGHLDPAHATITEFEYLASYSWLESDVPTILVPGSPPLWLPPAGPFKLEPDSGRVYIDENAARIPHTPLEPLFGALFAQNPDFEMGSVDIITDRNNIRKLLRFVGGTSSESFQIQVEIVDGKRALLTRIENETITVIQGFQGYGRNFEKACTKRATGTSGYHRITSFRFGGLKCVVRHETDGYIDDALGQATAQKQAETADSLPQLLETLCLADSALISTHTSTITIKRAGKEVDCSSILEIKTRAASKSLDMDETIAQLWISQTPQLAVSYHNNGLFNDFHIRDMAQNVRDWESSNQKVLCSLGYLLNQIIEVVKISASQAAVVRYDGGMKLEIVTVEPKKAPSEGAGAKWKGKQGTDDNKLMTEKGNQYKAPAQTSTRLPATTPITIGNVRYETDLSRIPRLGSLVPHSGESSTQSTEIVHEDIPLFNIALKGIESGYRHCFRSMPSDVSSYRTLCATYDFLRVDVCKGRMLGEIIKDLKAAQDYDDEYRDKSKARDAAFKLVYSIVQDTFQNNEKHKNTIFNAVLFVVSHPGTFKWKTRNAVRTVYESKFILSVKQRANLDRWHELDSEEQASTDEDDVTTEEENLNWYDSDYSDCS